MTEELFVSLYQENKKIEPYADFRASTVQSNSLLIKYIYTKLYITSKVVSELRCKILIFIKMSETTNNPTAATDINFNNPSQGKNPDALLSKITAPELTLIPKMVPGKGSRKPVIYVGERRSSVMDRIHVRTVHSLESQKFVCTRSD